jgi:hypothetical protein
VPKQWSNTITQHGKGPAKAAIAWLKHEFVNSNETCIHKSCSGVAKISPRYMENRAFECLTRLKCSVFDPVFVARWWMIYSNASKPANCNNTR